MKILKLIEQSIYKGKRPSSSRIFSYVMMTIIFSLGLTHIAIEIGNAAIVWKSGVAYVPSWQSISILAMWLAHQLTLMGIYKRSEANVPKIHGNDKQDELLKS